MMLCLNTLVLALFALRLCFYNKIFVLPWILLALIYQQDIINNSFQKIEENEGSEIFWIKYINILIIIKN